MVNEKRKARSYKVKDSSYLKAMGRAQEENGALANILENVVIAYSYGLDIKAVKTKRNGGIAIDVFSEDFAADISQFKK
jgi:hypothetical protein